MSPNNTKSQHSSGYITEGLETVTSWVSITSCCRLIVLVSVSLVTTVPCAVRELNQVVDKMGLI